MVRSRTAGARKWNRKNGGGGGLGDYNYKKNKGCSQKYGNNEKH